MKLLRFERTAGPSQWGHLYQRTSGLAESSYAEQLAAICGDMGQYAGAMQRTMTPLGYFFLAVFCVLTSAHSFRGLHLALLWAALVATLAGVGYLLSAHTETLQAGKSRLSHWLVRMFHLAQQPPVRDSKLTDEHGV